MYFSTFSQGENNVWIWGKESRLDFTPDGPVYSQWVSPIATPDNNARANISDQEGNLLLFSNKYRIYNRNIQPLSGTFERTDVFAESDDLFFLRKPGSDNRYLLLQSIANESIQWTQTEIDMSKDDGKGAVVTSGSLHSFEEKSSPNGLLIKGNCKRLWLLTTPIEWDRFKVFQIDENGINDSYTEIFFPEFLLGKSPQKFAVSDAADKITFVYATSPINFTLVICDFDRSTGIVSNFKSRDFEKYTTPYLLNFSPDGSKLYASITTVHHSHFSKPDILQFDLNTTGTSIPDPNSLLIPYTEQLDSVNMVFKFFRMNPFHFRMGPDNAIYTTLHKYTMMDVGRTDPFSYYESAAFYKISNPNAAIENIIFEKVEMSEITNLEPWFNNQFPLKNQVSPLSLGNNSATHPIFSCDTLPIAIASSVTDADYYIWNTGHTDISIEGIPGRTYWVEATICESKFTDTFYLVHYTDTMTGIASSFNEVLCAGALVKLSSKLHTPTSSYEWKNPNGRTLGIGPHIECNVYESGSIFLHETTPWGCGFTDSIHVAVKPCCNVVLPNSFSPNGDGLNDVYRIQAEADKKIEHFHIYNRYNELVFKTYNMYEGWDGTFKGQALPTGTYYYLVQYRCYGNESAINTIKGEVHLIR